MPAQKIKDTVQEAITKGKSLFLKTSKVLEVTPQDADTGHISIAVINQEGKKYDTIKGWYTLHKNQGVRVAFGWASKHSFFCPNQNI